MSGGGSKKVKPTEEEIALSEIARESWQRFQQSGVPVQNEAIARLTGYRLNEGTGEYEIDPKGPLNADGSTKTDVSDAVAATGSAFEEGLTDVNPNRLSAVDEYARARGRSGAEAATSMGLAQQDAPLQGLLGAAAITQGSRAEALTGQSQLAAEAQDKAIRAAQSAEDRSATNTYLVGQAASVPAAFAIDSRLKRGEKKPEETTPAP